MTYSKHLRHMHIQGDIDLVNEATDESTSATMNLHLLAHGTFTRTVTMGAPTGTDPMEYKQVDIRRSGVTARGHMGLVKVSPARIKLKNTEPLHVYWIKGRIPPTA